MQNLVAAFTAFSFQDIKTVQPSLFEATGISAFLPACNMGYGLQG
jgi:hypothetical protein